MPSAVWYWTVTVWSVVFDSDTVNVNAVVPELPSEIGVRSAIVSAGGVSSFTMVPTPRPSAIVALPGFLRLTRKVSSPSRLVSPVTSTVTVADGELAGMMSAPVAYW